MGTEAYLILITSIVVGLVSAAMPFTRRNKKFGVRTKWSMFNDRTWYYSNLFGAVFLICASAITIFSFFYCPKMLKIAFIRSICVSGLLSVLSSYIVFLFETRKK